MRRWDIAATLWFVAGAMPTQAWAQRAGGVAAAANESPAPPLQRIGYGALPGGLHVATAETLPEGTASVELLTGYGYRKGLLSTNHTLGRAIGEVAIAYAPLANLAIALSLDGRYDKNKGFQKTDDGYVGDPHLLARYAKPVGRVAVGGQLGVWVPGKNAPSIAASAISVDVRGLLSINAGFGTLTFDTGFRIDNSAKAVDHRETLSIEDQVSLGVSDFHAVLAGAQLRIPLGTRAYLGLEGSSDIFVGSGAPGPVIRGAGLVGVSLNEAFSLIGYVEAATAPGVTYRDPLMKDLVLVPFEPAITGGLGLQARFGGPQRTHRVTGKIVENERHESVIVAETAEVGGVVVDDAGKPVIGASVTVKLKNHSGSATTDDRGAYRVASLPIGKTVDGKTLLDDTGAEVSVEVANKKPSSTTLVLAKGANSVPKITLDPLLPPGQLRAVIINVGTSRPVNGASVTIDPGGITQTTGADGKFTIDLPPGKYKITVTARGLAPQQLDVNIEQNGVAIKNIDMHK